MRRLKIIVFSLIVLKFNRSQSVRYPVILVPGDGGTRIDAKLTDVKDLPHYMCKDSTPTYSTMWLSIHMLFALYVDCLVNYLQLHYNSTSRTTSDTPGVDLLIRGWGNTQTIDWLDTSHYTDYSSYFTDLSGHLEDIGYTNGWSLRGAPYDFRKAPNEMGKLLMKFQKLIEQTYLWNEEKPCVIVAHSMGNMVVHYFLLQMTQEWKDRYIRAFVTLAAPWGGSVKVMRLMAAGLNFAAPKYVVSAKSLRPLQRSMPSSAWLLPSPYFWGPNETIVTTPEKTYTINNYEQFFTDIGFKIGYELRKDTENLSKPLDPPGVEVYCLHGDNVLTEYKLNYNKASNFPDSPDILRSQDGDGTVNLRSLRGCLKWKGRQPQKVFHKTFRGVDHSQILHDADVLAYIQSVVMGGSRTSTLPTTTTVLSSTSRGFKMSSSTVILYSMLFAYTIF